MDKIDNTGVWLSCARFYRYNENVQSLHWKSSLVNASVAASCLAFILLGITVVLGESKAVALPIGTPGSGRAGAGNAAGDSAESEATEADDGPTTIDEHGNRKEEVDDREQDDEDQDEDGEGEDDEEEDADYDEGD